MAHGLRKPAAFVHPACGGDIIVIPAKTGIQIYEAVDNLKKSKEKPCSR
jgi:hypothetical protein